MLALLLTFSCFCFVGCESRNDCEGAPDSASYQGPEINEDNVTLLNAGYNGVDYDTSRGLDRRIFMGSAAKNIRKILAGLQPTGEIVPALSNTFEMPDYDVPCDMPAPCGTDWIEVDDIIYRVDQGRICAVNKHFGAGIVLDSSENAWDKIWGIRANRRGDYWEGDYIDGVLTIEHTAEEIGTTVSLRVKDVCAQQIKGGEGKVTLELTSSVDQTLRLKWKTFLSDDNIGSVDGERITFQAGETKELELRFEEAWNQYNFTISVDEVIMVRIYFHPPKEK